MKKRSRLDMERGILHSFQSREKSAFGELKMTPELLINILLIASSDLIKTNYLSKWTDLLIKSTLFLIIKTQKKRIKMNWKQNIIMTTEF